MRTKNYKIIRMACHPFIFTLKRACLDRPRLRSETQIFLGTCTVSKVGWGRGGTDFLAARRAAVGKMGRFMTLRRGGVWERARPALPRRWAAGCRISGWAKVTHSTMGLHQHVPHCICIRGIGHVMWCTMSRLWIACLARKRCTNEKLFRKKNDVAVFNKLLTDFRFQIADFSSQMQIPDCSIVTPVQCRCSTTVTQSRRGGERRRTHFWRRIALVPRFDIWAGSGQLTTEVI
jgi:hypothetical protein